MELFITIITSLFFTGMAFHASGNTEKIINSITWFGHASFMIKNKKVIYIDPWQLPQDAEKADLILVTHPHFDHLSVDDIRLIKKDDTVIITPPDGTSKLMGNIKEIEPGQEIDIFGIKIKAVPAYNTDKEFHPKKNDWVGYLIYLEEGSIYHAGDSDFIPEMENIDSPDVALLPVGGKYTMDAEQAAQAAQIIKPKVAIPMHYGAGVVGTVKDAQRFKELLKSKIEVRILTPVEK
jgi:L-ascorbate metabolism protein UlaG (beta-lactamase superfamily)